MTPTNSSPFRIGTRSSPLALAQAAMVKSALSSAHDWSDDAIKIVSMLSSGDKVQNRPLAEIGGKALWTKELERALIDGDIDIAVHSMKDVETKRDAHFSIAAMLPRADIRDRLVGAASIAALPNEARLGTSSPRRASQICHMRPDIQIIPLRGNVATRLAKIASGEADATLLAAAGLDRLGMGTTGVAVSIDEMLPAASQGAVGIDVLSSNQDIISTLSAINHQPTFACVNIERAFLAALGGSCYAPVAAHAAMAGTNFQLRAEIYSADGQERISGTTILSDGDFAPATLLAADLLARATAPTRALFNL